MTKLWPLQQHNLIPVAYIFLSKTEKNILAWVAETERNRLICAQSEYVIFSSWVYFIRSDNYKATVNNDKHFNDKRPKSLKPVYHLTS